MNRTSMKRLFLGAVTLGVLPGGYLAGNGVSKPVYVYLYARITDHVNIQLTEDRLRHLLPLMERYRQLRPESHLSATVLLSGAASQALQGRNAQTHILDFVKDYIRRGVIEHFAAQHQVQFCWLVRLTAFCRQQHYELYQPFHDHRTYGASRIILHD